MELIAYVADEAGIEYDMGTNVTIDQDVIPESKIALVVAQMKKKMPQEEQDAVEEEEPMVEPEAVPEENPQPSGLMARRM